MALNPYQPIGTPDASLQTTQTPLGSKMATGLSVCLLPAINEASIFWGHTEWLFWHFREMLPLGIKLWTIGMAVNLALFGVLTYGKQNTQIPWKLSVLVGLLPAIAYSAMCVIGHKAIYYDMYVWSALISLQIASVFAFRSSFVGKLLVGVACVSGLGIYLFHMMICSLVT